MEMTSNLPGLMGLYQYSPLSAQPMKKLAEEVLRNPSFSRIEPGKREIIAMMVAFWNGCLFCQQVHRAAAHQLVGGDYTDQVQDGKVERHMAQMLLLAAELVRTKPGSDWAIYLKKIVEAEPAEGEEMTELSERERHDVILIASMATMESRYVYYTEVCNPPLDWSDYMAIGKQIVELGYERMDP